MLTLISGVPDEVKGTNGQEKQPNAQGLIHLYWAREEASRSDPGLVVILRSGPKAGQHNRLVP